MFTGSVNIGDFYSLRAYRFFHYLFRNGQYTFAVVCNIIQYMNTCSYIGGVDGDI